MLRIASLARDSTPWRQTRIFHVFSAHALPRKAPKIGIGASSNSPEYTGLESERLVDVSNTVAKSTEPPSRQPRRSQSLEEAILDTDTPIEFSGKVHAQARMPIVLLKGHMNRASTHMDARSIDRIIYPQTKSQEPQVDPIRSSSQVNEEPSKLQQELPDKSLWTAIPDVSPVVIMRPGFIYEGWGYYNRTFTTHRVRMISKAAVRDLVLRPASLYEAIDLLRGVDRNAGQSRQLARALEQWQVRLNARGDTTAKALFPSDNFLPGNIFGATTNALRSALMLRKTSGVFGPQTTAFRLVHGEGDGLGGLVIDVYGSVVVIESSAMWAECHRLEIEAATRKFLSHATKILWRRQYYRLIEDGLVNRRLKKPRHLDEQSVLAQSSEWTEGIFRAVHIRDLRSSYGLEIDSDLGRALLRIKESGSISRAHKDADQQTASASKSRGKGRKGKSKTNDPIIPGQAEAPIEPVQVVEQGMVLQVDVMKGQKTGTYLDQRDNRAYIQSIAKGRRVLDLFCGEGGFSVAAALGGASYVHAVDESGRAIRAAERNAALNGVGTAGVKFEKNVVNRFLYNHKWSIMQKSAPSVSGNETTSKQAKQGKGPRLNPFDVVILDPPSIVRNRDDMPRAINFLKDGIASGSRMLDPTKGGLVVQFTCSRQLIATPKNEESVYEALRNALRSEWDGQMNIALVKTLHAGADHPLDAGRKNDYLRGWVFAVVPYSTMP
eukprot:Clim_evm17s144 gene=Clim_evmTU17s144